ncbi:hypothetical protein K3495_g1506 [Podosphaera aphanis]|nr:hypothetical protein K3495_g1506 [Podosphaera aphanis]
MTFRTESSHLAIKVYIDTSSGDHKHVFDAFFWEDQYRNIAEAIGQAIVKPRAAHQIQLFRDIISFAHPYALNLILEERARPPLKLDLPLSPCACKVKKASVFHISIPLELFKTFQVLSFLPILTLVDTTTR